LNTQARSILSDRRGSRPLLATSLLPLLALSLACGGEDAPDGSGGSGGAPGAPGDAAVSSGGSGSSSGGGSAAGGATGTSAGGTTSSDPAIARVDAVVAATRESLHSALATDDPLQDRVPINPDASDSFTSVGPCSGGGTARIDNETFDTETEIDICFVWVTLTDCVENGITMNGELYAELVGGAEFANDMFIVGTANYSTLGDCVWDAKGTGWDWLEFEFAESTVCGVPATSLQSYPQHPY
jgi:hypothetical protein